MNHDDEDNGQMEYETKYREQQWEEEMTNNEKIIFKFAEDMECHLAYACEKLKQDKLNGCYENLFEKALSLLETMLQYSNSIINFIKMEEEHVKED